MNQVHCIDTCRIQEKQAITYELESKSCFCQDGWQTYQASDGVLTARLDGGNFDLPLPSE